MTDADRDDDETEREPRPHEEEPLGDRFRGLNFWSYSRVEWDKIVRTDIRRMRHWIVTGILCCAVWGLVLRWFGVFSATYWLSLNRGHPEEILGFLT